jgi:hypothetical protein
MKFTLDAQRHQFLTFDLIRFEEWNQACTDKQSWIIAVGTSRLRTEFLSILQKYVQAIADPIRHTNIRFMGSRHIIAMHEAIQNGLQVVISLITPFVRNVSCVAHLIGQYLDVNAHACNSQATSLSIPCKTCNFLYHPTCTDSYFHTNNDLSCACYMHYQ